MSLLLVGFSRKALQAVVIWIPAFLILWLVWRPAFYLAPLWMVAIIGVFANALQPSYRPLEGSRTPEDRGTAVQILWTVYLTQVAALVELVWRRRVALPLDLITWSALSAMVGGLALRTSAVVLLGPWFTWNVTVQPGQALVNRGPYRYLRHPSYTGALVVFVASCVLLRSWGAAVLATIALTLAFRRRIRYEEALLVDTLPGYLEYRSRTGGLLPRILTIKDCVRRFR